MNKMICPFESVTSLRKALSRSSNSPRYFAPASMPPRSSVMTRLFFIDSGTSPETMRRARPSTMAVLPTPGSPMSTGLFLVRRERTCMTRRISLSRPMTGSIFPSRARAVRSVPYFSSVWYLPSGFSSVTFWLPRTDLMDSRAFASVRPLSLSNLPAGESDFSAPNKKCSTLRKSSPKDSRASSAASRFARSP